MQNPAVPPKNALAREPHITRYFSSYNLCKTLNCLPEAGGLLDQDAAWVFYAGVFASAEAEHQRTEERS